MVTLEEIVPVFGQNPTLLREAHVYFSQSGEDAVLEVLLQKQTTKGCFVDVGAYHPFRFSNTFLLYLQGWRGINVDANEEAIELFKVVRPEDVSICALVGPKAETMEYFRFREGAWNTTNAQAARDLAARPDSQTQVVDKRAMTTVPINDILTEYVGDRQFDFLNIDIEGMDEELLYSIDFERFRPKVICIELDLRRCLTEPMASFLKLRRYEVTSQTVHSAFLTVKE
jgi:hypothetical protein